MVQWRDYSTLNQRSQFRALGMDKSCRKRHPRKGPTMCDSNLVEAPMRATHMENQKKTYCLASSVSIIERENDSQI